MPRPPVQKTRKLAYAETLGKLEAEEHFYRLTHKFTAESLGRRLQDHLGKMLDNASIKDLIDIIAAIGMTPVTYAGVKEIENITKILNSNPLLTSLFSGLAGGLQKQFELQIPKEIQDIATWGFAFAVSWCVVKWGDKMISAGLGSLTGITGMLTKA